MTTNPNLITSSFLFIAESVEVRQDLIVHGLDRVGWGRNEGVEKWKRFSAMNIWEVCAGGVNPERGS